MRVVPLTHYGFVGATEGLFKSTKDKALEQQWRSTTNRILTLQTATGQFNNEHYKTIAGLLNTMEDKDLRMKRKFVLNNLATYMKENEMLPAIAFVFSRKQVEACAGEITAVLLEDDSKVPYTLKYECDAILRKLPNWQEYANLPEYQTLVGWMEKGIAIHHSGMIPILREIVELMISKGYIKLLFATESFAIGLDCPIRTAVFTGLTKYDGNTQRLLQAHEYTQMAGRAGRRGIDTIGYVVHCNNLFPCPSPTEYKTMLGGRPQKLVSKFHIHYGMVLNLLKQGDTGFVEFAHKSMLQDEMDKMTVGLQIQCDETHEAWTAKLQHAPTTMRTPMDVCVEYLDATAKLRTSVNKRRKELERAMKQMEDTHKYIRADAQFVAGIRELETAYYSAKTAYENALTYVETQTAQICEIMAENGFLVTDTRTMTHLGVMASHIAEEHPLVLAECIQHTHVLQSLDVFQIVGWLSCFTDVRVPEEERAIEPHVEDAKLQSLLEYTQSRVEWYKSEELVRHLQTGMDTTLQFDLVEAMMYWAEMCVDELQCKQFLQHRIQVSAGDFTKACLKICNLAEQLGAVCEVMGYVECQHKLSQIPKMLLKYVATAQSLYL
jgi:superfamily II RNA helicase